MASAGCTWSTWVMDCGDTTTADTSASTWKIWVGGSCTTANTYSDTAWASWTSGELLIGSSRKLTAEELEQRRVENERRQAEIKAQEEARQASENKAKELLTAHLSVDQKESLDKISAIVVETEDRRRFRIKKGWAGNVEELDEKGKPIARYCIHPTQHVPEYDNMLAQKFMIESNLNEFIRIANRTALAH